MSETIETILPQSADFDPQGDFEPFLKSAPAKWVVYMLADADDRPVQLLCVKNLRNSLRRRLGVEELQPDVEPALSRRVNYREIVRRIRWRRVDSAFEADWIYHEAARRLFPQTYRGMVGFRPAWFVHVDAGAPFPRFVKTVDLSDRPGMLIGPVEDKHAAARLIQLIEDAFDLCRYYNVLTQAPHGRACAYKEMGRCDAPCDGSVPMEKYREDIRQSVVAIIQAETIILTETARMKQAAAELNFERAARIKLRIEKLSTLGKGPFRYANLINDFRFLSLQRGPGERKFKLFFIAPGHIEELAGVISPEGSFSELLRCALEKVEAMRTSGVDEIGAERIGIVSHTLFSEKQRGVFIRMADVQDNSITKGCRELAKQRTTDEETPGEGVMKELQAI